MGRTLQVEDRISHYRVVALLGAGGMGEVYAAQDESLDRSVALKTLPPHLVRNEERLRRFITEAKSASSLNHPNIVTIYEIGRDDVRSSGPAHESSPAKAESIPVHFIAMELVSGETLTQKIHHEKTDLRTLLGYLAQAAEGIAKAHAAGIVHRDLKPGNIMISRDGFAKVLDFGLAKLTEKQPAPNEQVSSAPTEGVATGEGVILGTVGYMSPEQVQGKPADHRSDIFSMGCVLYEAATRKRPFAADTDVEIMHRILRDRPVPIEDLNAEVPGEVRRLIRRCLAKSPDQRFQSMKDLAIELREVVDEYESLSPTATSAGTLTSAALGALPIRRKGPLILIAAVLVVGLGGLAVGLYGLMGGGVSKSSTDSSIQQMKISVLMNRNDLEEGVLSSDGRYLAYVTSVDGRSRLSVRQVRTGSEVQILPPQEYPIRGISFSPEGDYLYYLNLDPDLPNYRALFQVASLGGAPRKIAFDVDTAITFSPDGRSICFRRGIPQEQADSLVIVVPETGEERELIRIKAPEVFSTADDNDAAPAWSPDGERIAVAVFNPTGGARTRVATVDVESGKREWVGSKSWLFVNSFGWMPDGRDIMLSAYVFGSRDQIYRLSFPDGDVAKLTSDLDGYTGLSLSSDGRSIAAIRRTNVRNVWTASLDPAGESHPVTNASGSAASVEFIEPLSDGGVAFTAAEGDRVYLWRAEPDGSDRRQLTTQGTYVLSLAFAPGAGITFTQIETEGIGHVWRVDPDGGGLRQLTTGQGEALDALSPDGKTALFTRWDDQSILWSLNPAGGEPTRLVSDYGGRGVSFAPDSRSFLYTAYDTVEGRQYPRRMVIPAAGGKPLASFLLPPGAIDMGWAPDGKSVTYIDRGKGFNLMRQPIAGGEPEQLTRFDKGRLEHHRWSPDGSRVALQRQLGQRDSLWTLQPGEREPVMITEFQTGSIQTLRWAADSRRLIFTYGTSSQDVVLITDFR